MRPFAIVCSALVGGFVLYSPTAAPAKTAKECRTEWQANKADYQAKNIREKDYIKQCTAGVAAAQPPATAKTNPETRKASRSTSATAAAPPKSSTGSAGAYQYPTDAQARVRCGSGTVIWANLNSKIYHFAGHKDYGNTKSGAYMCERDAANEGMRAAKNEKHP